MGTSRRCLSPILRLSKPLFYVAVLFSLTSSETIILPYAFSAAAASSTRVKKRNPAAPATSASRPNDRSFCFSFFHRRRSGFKVQRVPEWYVTLARRRPDGSDLLCFFWTLILYPALLYFSLAIALISRGRNCPINRAGRSFHENLLQFLMSKTSWMLRRDVWLPFAASPSLLMIPEAQPCMSFRLRFIIHR